MKKLEGKSAGPVRKVKSVLARPLGPGTRAPVSGGDVSESFRSARSALGQISADLEHLRRHAASLVKGAHRPTK